MSLVALVGGVGACTSDDNAADQNGSALNNGGTAGSSAGSSSPGGAGVGGAVVGGASGASGSGGASATSFACVDPKPFLVDGVPTGLVTCADGGYERTGAAVCKLSENVVKLACPPSANGGGAGAGGSAAPYDRCDTACDDGKHGVPFENNGPGHWTNCDYYCETDVDCPGGNRCVCGPDGVGLCGKAECGLASDCGAGEICRVKDDLIDCGRRTHVLSLVCVGPGDACLKDSDCSHTGGGYFCLAGAVENGAPGPRSCVGPYACGRPILIEDAPRVAMLVSGSAWS